MKYKEVDCKEAALAWAQGKRVEAKWVEAKFGEDAWAVVDAVGEDNSGHYGASVFNYRSDYTYRIATEPTYRPFKPEEVPVGALIRHNRAGGVGLILGNGASKEFGIAVVDGTAIKRVPYRDLLDGYEYSTDGGKTWLPCGAEVEA